LRQEIKENEKGSTFQEPYSETGAGGNEASARPVAEVAKEYRRNCRHFNARVFERTYSKLER